MSVYLVTWNLNKEGQHYSAARTKFLTGFTGLDSSYAGKTLDTVALVNTPSTAIQLYNHLVKNLDTNDRLFVTKIFKGMYHGWLDLPVVNWLTARL